MTPSLTVLTTLLLFWFGRLYKFQPSFCGIQMPQWARMGLTYVSFPQIWLIDLYSTDVTLAQRKRNLFKYEERVHLNVESQTE